MPGAKLLESYSSSRPNRAENGPGRLLVQRPRVDGLAGRLAHVHDARPPDALRLARREGDATRDVRVAPHLARHRTGPLDDPRAPSSCNGAAESFQTRCGFAREGPEPQEPWEWSRVCWERPDVSHLQKQ